MPNCVNGIELPGMPVEEHHILPNGVEVIFYPDTHKYVVNGKEVPSITTLIQDHYGNKYAAVRPEILEASARYGTRVHAELDQFITLRQTNPDTPITSELTEVKNYFDFVEPIYDIKPVMTERVVVLYDRPGGNIVAAGRFDLLCLVKGILTLADFKTTSTILKQSVSAQLNLYRIAAYQSGYIDRLDINLGVIHLSGNKSVYVPIQRFADNFHLTFIV